MDNKASRSNAASSGNDTRLSRRTFVCGSFAAAMVASTEPSLSQEPPIPVPMPIAQGVNYFECVETHFDRLIHYALDRYGSTRSAIWMSSLDINTNELSQVADVQPANDMRFVPGAYWYADQPMLVAAHAVATRSACKCYSDSADEYLRSYFHLVNDDASLQSLRETYWDAADDRQQPVGLLRSMLPSCTPAWETMWRVGRERTTRIINREADRLLQTSNLSMPELNIAIESLLWLARQSDERKTSASDHVSLLVSSGENQNKPPNKLMPRSQSVEAMRFSANCLAAAKSIDKSWLHDIGLEFGNAVCNLVADDAKANDALASAINEMDLRIAQCCLAIEGASNEIQLGDLVNQTVNRIGQALNNADHAIETSGVFGRAIYFLQSASISAQRPEYLELAKQVADVAIDKLFVEDCGMFRSRVGVDRCDAVDGIGYLMLALLAIDDNDPTAGSAFSF
ncbi:MAG: hypothetical protein WBD20_26990 [Pirellulaceae bacterium]